MPQQDGTELNTMDLLLLAVIGVLAIVLWFSLPRLGVWGWCLRALDMRFWSWWTWAGIGAALVAVLAAIRLWPERGQE